MHKEVLVNPAPRLIGQQNAVLSGRGRQYDVRGFASPLSIKSVIRGSATWTTAAGRFVLEPGSALIVNGGEEYDLTIDALQLVETFCIFFSRGFVEDAYRATTSPSAALLDAPPPERQRSSLANASCTHAATAARRAVFARTKKNRVVSLRSMTA